jgi:serine/threonine-protein kinase
MPTKIGHFEILSELAKSETATVYKATDPQTGQTVALKAIRLSAFGQSAGDLEAALLAEAESTKSLSSPNIVAVLGAGEIEGQFCATMEYVQGNSVSTMLERQEGFSIWDLLDIGRQVCGGLDHAHSHQVFHHSLEPAKIMCGWDGTVKILGFGVSSVGKFAPETAESPVFLHYMSPEQLRGDPIDGRSNLFSLGAMFYEMMTGREPFAGPDTESLCQNIVEAIPTPPLELNAKIHPLLSQLIMKTLDKDPERRYQSGRELLEDLERCKESKADSKAQPAKKPAQSSETSAIPHATKAAAQAKFVAPAATKTAPAKAAAPSLKVTETVVRMAGNSPASSPAAAAGSQIEALPSTAKTSNPPAPRNAVGRTGQPSAVSGRASAYASDAVETLPRASAASAPKIAVDPMMAEGAGAGKGTSFSEISELPPLKEIYVEPPPPSPAFEPEQTAAAPGGTVYQDVSESEEKEKEKVQPREVAQKAIKEITSVPPRLMLYAVGGAVALILAIGIGLAIHIHNLNGDDDSGAAHSSAPVPTSAAQPATSAQNGSAEPVIVPGQPTAATDESAAPVEAANATPVAAGRVRGAKNKSKKVSTPPPVAVVPGQLALDSTPLGAQVQIDGRTDPSYITPFLLPGLTPGSHTITVSKAGYSSDTRSVEIASGNKTSLAIHLAQLMATISVTSNPAGASIFVDGKDVGKATPAQVNVDKGQHVVLIRKMGFLDETTSPQFVLGQTVNWSPEMRPLGNADNIRSVAKIKKLFGGSGADPGQLTVTIKTQPKGAQVAINQKMIEKGTPVEVAVDPGNYVVDITLTGYAPIHKVITAEKGSKLIVDEVLQKQ